MHNIITSLTKIQKQINDFNKEENTKLPNIIAVSKTFPMEKIIPLVEHGHVHFGENKVQEAFEKWPKIKEQYPHIKLHMLGKIQSNKVKFLLPLFDFIHSLDNLKLAQKISDSQINKKIKPGIFIQINIGNEVQKNGIDLDNLKSFYEECVNNLGLNIIGLMCLPPADKKPEKYFKLLNELNKSYQLKELSMGMSADYLDALKYGATYLRLGSIIFGSRS